MSSSATEERDETIALAAVALGSLLHDGELVAIQREPETITLTLRPAVGDFPEEGPHLVAHFSGLRVCSVHANELPREPTFDPYDEAARKAWWARISRRSVDWRAFEAEIGPTSAHWYEIMDARLATTAESGVELELYGPVSQRPPFDNRLREERWRWVTVRAAEVAWSSTAGLPLDLDMAVALAIAWWDHWARPK